MVSPFSSDAPLAKVAQHAQRLFFASVVSAMQIPERQHSELAKSLRVFERGGSVDGMLADLADVPGYFSGK
jgi:hypothetical protein